MVAPSGKCLRGKGGYGEFVVQLWSIPECFIGELLTMGHYTPWTIKMCHIVFDYNSGFSWSIFILFVPVETRKNTLQKVNKIYHLALTVSPHYLVKLKLRVNSTFWSQSSVRSIEPVVRNFHRKSLNVHIFQSLVFLLSVFWQKHFHIPTGF